MQKGSYIAAWDLGTGKQLWKTARTDEIPTWGTPALVTAPSGRSELVTNGTKIRGYDPSTGKLLWTLGPNSEVTVGTPVTGHGLVFVTGGYPPVRPIYAIRPGAGGDISLPKGSESSDAIAWSNMTDGTYIPTPLVYGQYLFTMGNNGIVNAYNAQTGAARVSRSNRHGRRVLSVSHRRRRPFVCGQRGRRDLCRHCRTGAHGDRQERYEGSHHGDTRDL